MTRLPRDDILDRTDLPALADELLGPRRGRGPNPTWPCPSHTPQSGRTPPVSIFATTRGEQRWHCHACGAGGTAIDLLIATHGMDVRTALEALDHRTALRPTRPPTRPAPAPAPTEAARAAVSAHADRCAQLLWTDQGRPVREWLHDRGLTDATLHTHHVGADPGPRVLTRPRGLPQGGPAAILPVRGSGNVVYFQARYLDPMRSGGRKYDNPIAALAPNPHLANFTPTIDTIPAAVFVCEGIPDALTVTQSGHRAVAVLGAGLAGPHIARRLNNEHPEQALRIAFDADTRGVAARDALVDELRALGHPDTQSLLLPHGVHDLNDWLRSDATDLARSLDAVAQPVAAPNVAETIEL